MSKGNHRTGVYVDVGLLRDHVSKLREEKKTAMKLYDSVVMMRECSELPAGGQYSAVLRDVNQLIEYFNRMARVLAEAEDEAIRISKEIGIAIEDETELTRHTSSQNYML